MIRFKCVRGVFRVYETDHQTGMMKMGSSAQDSGLDLRFADLLPFINYGE